MLKVRYLKCFAELHSTSSYVVEILPDSFKLSDACSKKEHLEVKPFRTLNEFSNIFFQSFTVRPMI